ncbi:MAG: GDP-mannose 4,6-dehydratase [Alphaproteobacteria bacterium]|nr:GDP-mannose 4,6-dehydratase [Alphaproteobacteria bacterium]
MAGRILITGAGGFLGRHIVDALLEQGSAPGDLSAAIRGTPALPAGVALHDVDLAEGSETAGMVQAARPDVVLHLAGAASVAVKAGEGGRIAWRDNVQTTITLASELRATHKSPAILLASSAEVYGRNLLGSAPTTEETAPRPAGVYGRTKLAAEQAIADIVGDAGQAIALRLFNSAGPGQDERFVVSAFAAQVARIEAGQAPPVLRVGNLDSERDFLDVRDTARAWALLADAAWARRLSATVFNVASGEPRSIRSIVDDLAHLARRRFEVEIDPARARPSEIPRASGDARRLAAATGWQPRISWLTTLSDTLDHWRAVTAQGG